MPVGCPSGIQEETASEVLAQYPNPGEAGTTPQAILQAFRDIMPGVWNPGSGFNNRTINGSKTLSMHATGLAIDLVLTDSPNQSDAVELIYQVSAIEYLVRSACALGITLVIAERDRGRSTLVWNVGTDPGGADRRPMLGWRELANQSNAGGGPMHLHVEVHSTSRNSFSTDDIKNLFLSYGDPKVVLSTTTVPTQPAISGNPAGSNPLATATYTIKPTTDTSGWGVSPDLTGCASCGDPWKTKVLSDACDPLTNPGCGVISLTQCGGTGAVCIERSTGKLCSVGTAVTLGLTDFSQGVVDAMFHGPSTVYALLADGRTVEGRGLNPTSKPSFTFPPRTQASQKFTNLYTINPTTIGLTAVNSTGFGTGRGASVSGKATVADVSALTCC